MMDKNLLINFWKENNIFDIDSSKKLGTPINAWYVGCIYEDPLDTWYDCIYNGSNKDLWFTDKKPLMESILKIAQNSVLKNKNIYYETLRRLFPVYINWSKLSSENTFTDYIQLYKKFI